MNWKKLWFGLLAIGIPVVLLGQTIRWYNDAVIPQKVNLVGTEIFSLQQTGPNAYRWVLASDMRRYMSGEAGVPVTIINVTNLYVTSNYVTYQYVTNQFVNLSYITNLYVTTNNVTYEFTTNEYVTFSYTTNLYVTTNIVNNEWVTNQYVTYSFTTNEYITYLTNLYSYTTNAYITELTVLSNAYFFETNFVNNEYVTNLYVESNAYFYETNFVNWEITTNLTVISNAWVRNFYVTNLYVQVAARVADVAWTGPTNQVDFSLGSLQYYATLVPISITNVIGATSGYGNTCLLCITNTSGSNITYTLTASGWHSGRGDPTSVTNGGILELWFQEATGRKTLAVKEFIP